MRNRVKNYATNKIIRKDAVFAEHYVISASREFFKQRPNRTKRLNEWVDEQIKFLKNEFGANLVTAVLHLDETTPHIEAFVTPIIANKNGDLELNRKAFNNARGGLNSFTQLQERHAKHNEKLGLERGLPKRITEIEADTLTEYYKLAKKYKEDIKDYDPPKLEDLIPKKSWGFYKIEDIKIALKKALRISSKIYKKALDDLAKYKKINDNAMRDKARSELEKKEIEDKYNEQNKRIKSMVKVNAKNLEFINELKPWAELGKKADELGLKDQIETKYNYVKNPHEQVQQVKNDNENKKVTGFKMS